MVSQLAKSQYSHDDEQQSSLLMVGLSSNSRSNTGEVNSSEKHTLPKSNTGIRRPATTVKVSYNRKFFMFTSYLPVKFSLCY